MRLNTINTDAKYENCGGQILGVLSTILKKVGSSPWGALKNESKTPTPTKYH
jgi:hypothetical protein